MNAEQIIPTVTAAMANEMRTTVDFFMLALLFLMVLIDKNSPEFCGSGIYHNTSVLSNGKIDFFLKKIQYLFTVQKKLCYSIYIPKKKGVENDKKNIVASCGFGTCNAAGF